MLGRWGIEKPRSEAKPPRAEMVRKGLFSALMGLLPMMLVSSTSDSPFTAKRRFRSSVTVWNASVSFSSCTCASSHAHGLSGALQMAGIHSQEWSS